MTIDTLTLKRAIMARDAEIRVLLARLKSFEALYDAAEARASDLARRNAELVEALVSEILAEIAEVKETYDPGEGPRPSILASLSNLLGRVRARAAAAFAEEHKREKSDG